MLASSGVRWPDFRVGDDAWNVRRGALSTLRLWVPGGFPRMSPDRPVAQAPLTHASKATILPFPDLHILAQEATKAKTRGDFHA